MTKESYENYMMILANTVSRRQTEANPPEDLKKLQGAVECVIEEYEELRGIERNRGELAMLLADTLDLIYPTLAQIYADLLVNLMPAVQQDKARSVLIGTYELMQMLSGYAIADERIRKAEAAGEL